MNRVIAYKIDSMWISEWRAYEEGNEGNEDWGASEKLAIQNLMAKQNPTPEKIKEDVVQYLKEIEERIDTFIASDTNAGAEYSRNQAVSDELRVVSNTLTSIFKERKLK